MALAIVTLGLVAGALTTLSGAGGGVLLTLCLSALLGPHAALAVTAPALLAGNAHRVLLYRRQVDRSVALPIVLGALPGSLIGGAFAARVPAVVLQACLAGATAYSIARASGAWEWAPPRGLLAPAGAAVGVFSGTSGGAGLLVSTLLMSAGLTGEAYVATSAAIAAAMHVGRLSAYGASGLLSAGVLSMSALATVAVLAGNVLGGRLRSKLSGAGSVRFLETLEKGTLAVAAALALLGVGR